MSPTRRKLSTSTPEIRADLDRSPRPFGIGYGFVPCTPVTGSIGFATVYLRGQHPEMCSGILDRCGLRLGRRLKARAHPNSMLCGQCCRPAGQIDQRDAYAVSRLRSPTISQAANRRLVNTHTLRQKALAEPARL